MHCNNKHETFTTMNTQSTTKCRFKELTTEQKEQFTAYFMARYPETRKIKFSSDEVCRYTVRIRFAGEKMFMARAYSFDKLQANTQAAYEKRGFHLS